MYKTLSPNGMQEENAEEKWTKKSSPLSYLS